MAAMSAPLPPIDHLAQAMQRAAVLSPAA